jgi:hypothetical protein
MLKKSILIIFLILFLVNVSGCAALLAGAVGGAGTAGWLSGKLIQEVKAPSEKALRAVKSALKSLKLNVIKESKGENIIQVISKYSDGRKVWIDIHRLSSSTSRLEVRVGAVGDKEAARKILDKIIRYL